MIGGFLISDVMHVFYQPDVAGEIINLDRDESKHAVQVLRIIPGQRIIILDGKGSILQCEVVDAHKSALTARVIEKNYKQPLPYQLEIAIAPTKMNDRMEWFLEKATEIGVQRITPVICDRSERREVNHDRFQRVIISAMKQSMNPWLPELSQQVSFDHFIQKETAGYIAHCEKDNQLLLWNELKSEMRSSVLIGPEGDFTPGEIKSALSHKWKPVSLGSSRLRTETAGVMVAAAYKMVMDA
jgi:16S rRNA (uracil1498-N3)-methyltransferase